jgi:tricorn protease
MSPLRIAFPALVALLFVLPVSAAPLGYYRQPALHKDTLVFVSEGDLWKVSVKGGVATRLTTHAGEEGLPAISPDGKTVAFTAQYEGPTDVYSMPLTGGPPRRHTFDGAGVAYIGWAPGGKLLVATNAHSTLPNHQLLTIDVGAKSQRRSLIPLAQAADGCYDEGGKVLFFTRLPFQGSHTKRYKGGTAQNLWKFTAGADEAVPLTAKYAGTSKSPMWWQGRVYFVSDRDGTMNIWSMRPDGADLTQHTKHRGWDVASPSLSAGRIAYQLGADIHVHDIAAKTDRKVPITLDSDLDQTRERWVKEPTDYLSAAHLSPSGDRVALTARGRAFVAPHRRGRLVEAPHKEGVRYRDARFMPDGKSLLVLSDQSGEVELWKLPANGVGKGEQLTTDGEVLRVSAVPSPNGKFIAHTDKNQRLYLYDVEKKQNKLLDESKIAEFAGLTWSPDSAWLAYVAYADNFFQRIKLCRISTGAITHVTSDRFDSYAPAFSPDGKWLYLLSDRNLRSVVSSPWGNYQPEPFLDKKTRIYHLALRRDQRSPFDPPSELETDKEKKEENGKDEKKPKKKAKSSVPAVTIDLAGIETRLYPVPVPAGNYRSLQVNDKGLFWLSSAIGKEQSSLESVAFARQDVEVKTVADSLSRFELSRDGKKLLIHKSKGSLAIVDASPAAATLKGKSVDLSGWSLSIVPREEWRQMFDEAWRLERDYFYDRGMHGLDWKAVRKKYAPLVERVHNRAELSDLLAQMVSELSALHIFVYGGDARKGPDRVELASLGAELERDEEAGGYRVKHIYQSDPDEPERASPLARPRVGVRAGDVITMVDGKETLSVADIALLLRNKAGRQVLLRVKPGAGKAKERDVIVRPINRGQAADLRYHEWEHTRRLQVESASKGDIGYVHLRAMGGRNFTEWAKGFYPVFTRSGLIIDVRHNQGGNIDSWILGRLLRKPWFYWTQRVGQAPMWNMQYAFRGHVVVLVNEWTASDGEAFAEGFRRLKLGKVIGTRTWGGEIWLTSSNFLVDRGIATAAEFGVYGPEGAWLIEGHGVDPDIVVDNLPHATFKGKDAQLDAAIAHLQKLIRDQPVRRPPVPKYPNVTKPR